MKKIFPFLAILFLSSNLLASNYDGEWYGTNPCAYFDQSQDVVLTIKDGKAKVDWGEEFKPTKYRGKVLKNDKLGLNSNAGRIEGKFTSHEELILNEGKDFTNDDGETISCEFTLNKGAMKEEKTEEQIAEEAAQEQEEEEKAEVVQSVENIPQWFLIPPDGGKVAAFATATWESSNLQSARKFAENQALESLALTLDSRVTLQINTMIDQVGLNDDETLATEMTSVGNTTVREASTTGYKIEEIDVQTKGTKYVVYILLKLRFSEADNILMKQIKSTDTSEGKLKASKAFQELEEAISQSS